MRRLPDGTWYCEPCDRRFDSESLHVTDVTVLSPEAFDALEAELEREPEANEALTRLFVRAREIRAMRSVVGAEPAHDEKHEHARTGEHDGAPLDS